MNVKITARHMEVTEALRNYTEKKVSRLSKYNLVTSVEVIFDNEGLTHKVEMIIKTDNHQPFVVSRTEENAYACLDAAIDKIERKLIRNKEKTRNHKGRAGAAEATAEVLKAQIPAEEEGS